MRVAIRADAATHIGIGHVMRCLTLANALKMKGDEVSFVCRPFAGHLGERITAEGHGLYLLPPPSQTIKPPHPKQTPSHATWLGENWETDLAQTQIALNGKQFDWLIVDHYSLDNRWENEMRNFASKIMVIDDLADRRHDCDLLLDQNLGRSEREYKSRVSENCILLTGSKYALLRPEFKEWRDYSLKRRSTPQMKNLLITLGGIDKDNTAGKVLEALRESSLPTDCCITVVMGSSSLGLTAVRQTAKTMPWQVEVQVNVTNMADLMAGSDLCIGAAGSTSWERCCLGLPTIMMILGDNQRGVGSALEKEQAVFLCSNLSDIKEIINVHCGSAKRMNAMSQASRCVTDGSGLELVIRHIGNPIVN
jgi:UDP-2,4-diacetamido-2,4,6-trideoxy-beta-L-altropyranose hydrolase